MNPVIFSLCDSEELGARLAQHLDAEIGSFEQRRFPDGESYIRVDSTVSGRPVILCCTLHKPDDKLLPLRFLAETCRELGATSVGLAAPYLAYMRQDRRFHAGEAVTSRHFAKLLSDTFDWLVTVDPHLHRIHALSDLYSIATRTIHAAPAVSKWIAANVTTPLLVGPDSESEQWVGEVARDAGAPWIVLEKKRHGDRDVSVSLPGVDRWKGHTPVLVDDIISTARTMIETIQHLNAQGMAPPICIGVHAVFAGEAYGDLQNAHPARVATCNTISHETNQIDVLPQIADAVRDID